uniref:Uncharacterized protein n=1 Tax=Panagrolaimus sp. ES5 TaxID=591445 RepID=A0AC34G016_9BILA
MCISNSEYEQELKAFVAEWNSIYSTERWKLGNRDRYFYAELKYLSNEEKLWIHAFIINNFSYDVPQLWFNVYEPGTIQKRLSLENAIRSEEFLGRCSEEEHPFLGVGFYYVDPCRVIAATKEIPTVSDKIGYKLLKWFFVAVQPTRLRSPLEMAKQFS